MSIQDTNLSAKYVAKALGKNKFFIMRSNGEKQPGWIIFDTSNIQICSDNGYVIPMKNDKLGLQKSVYLTELLRVNCIELSICDIEIRYRKEMK
jgi:hypothetical protein